MQLVRLLLLLALPGSVAWAQVDFTGMWSPVGSRPDNPEMGDYTGMPISQANRLRAESWAANMMEVAENVCRPYPMEDPFGPAQLAVSKEVDNTTQQVIAYHTKGARNYSSTGTLA